VEHVGAQVKNSPLVNLSILIVHNLNLRVELNEVWYDFSELARLSYFTEFIFVEIRETYEEVH